MCHSMRLERLYNCKSENIQSYLEEKRRKGKGIEGKEKEWKVTKGRGREGKRREGKEKGENERK